MQIDRLFEIIYILMEKESVSAKELAERLEVSTKTIYRAIERLCMAGMPIYTSKGKGGGISLMKGFVIDKALFNEEEKLNIISAVQAFNQISPPGQEKTTRLNSFFGDRTGDWIEVDFSSWVNPEEEREMFNTLKNTILNKQVLSFLYANQKGEKTERTVEPLKLGFKNQAWYLYAYCRTRNAPRFFKLIRMKDLRVREETFDKNPPGQIFPDFNVFNDQYTPLILKLSPKAAYRVYEEFSEIEKQEDGSYIVKSTCPTGPWLFSYIASFGEHCEVLEPADIREEYIKRIQKTLNIYLK